MTAPNPEPLPTAAPPPDGPRRIDMRLCDIAVLCDSSGSRLYYEVSGSEILRAVSAAAAARDAACEQIELANARQQRAENLLVSARASVARQSASIYAQHAQIAGELAQTRSAVVAVAVELAKAKTQLHGAATDACKTASQHDGAAS